MSTRGFVGWMVNGKLKGWYNHFDSYYSGLELEVLEKYKKHNRKMVRL